MGNQRTNMIYSLSEKSILDEDCKKLVEKLSYLSPKIADYFGHDNTQQNQVLRAYFKLSEKIYSKEDLEKKLISEGIISERKNLHVQETLETEKGIRYFLSPEFSKFVVYFFNPKQ